MTRDLLDLHGYKTEDVESEVDHFLLEISQSNLKRARIMTGKGTGAVQKVVISYLKQAGYQWAFEKSPKGDENRGVIVLFLD